MPVPEDSAESAYDQPSESTFNPYDPEAVLPTSVSPSPLSQTPGVGDTSGTDGTAPEGSSSGEAQGPGDTPEPIPEFDSRWKDEFTGLIYLGKLTDTFMLWNHTFVVRTLTTEEIAEVALIVKDYEGTLVETQIYQSAVVATAVITADDQPLPEPLVKDESPIRYRAQYVMRNWAPPVREAIFNKYFALEVKTRRVLEEMGKASG